MNIAIWGGYCGSTPRQGIIVGYASDAHTGEPQVVIAPDDRDNPGELRVLPATELREHTEPYPEYFQQAIADWERSAGLGGAPI